MTYIFVDSILSTSSSKNSFNRNLSGIKRRESKNLAIISIGIVLNEFLEKELRQNKLQIPNVSKPYYQSEK